MSFQSISCGIEEGHGLLTAEALEEDEPIG